MLPGGGQNRFETLEEAAVREVEEETGYRVKILWLAALLELIFDQNDQSEGTGDYAHWAVHIFTAELTGAEKRGPAFQDWRQCGSEWIPPREADSLCVRPAILRGRLSILANAETACYLGADHVGPGD